MKKSEIVDLLHANKIFNNHELCVRFGETQIDDVCVSHNKTEGHRPGGACVFSPSHKTDPNSHWTHRGAKFFYGNKSTSVKEAEVWASETYKVKEWKNSPFGGKIPDTVYERLQKFIKEQT